MNPFPLPLLLAVLVGCSGVGNAKTDRPNVIIILADDMGWGDARCYQADSKISTPNLDRIAAEGMRFTDAHTPSSVCTPTRYTLLTGRYCWRTWLKRGVLGGFGPPLIEEGDDNLASLLKRKGYNTACIGKWHIGMNWFDRDGKPIAAAGDTARKEAGEGIDFERDAVGGPVDIGFDTFFGISASLDMPPYAYMKDRRLLALPTELRGGYEDSIFINGTPGVQTPGFDIYEVLGKLGEKAETYIHKQAKQSEPFFLYMPLNSPHKPVSPAEMAKGKSEAGKYGDFVWETDHVVGRVLDALDASGAADNTLVLFTSDNGGLFHWWDFRAADDGGAAPATPRGDYVKQFNHQSNADWRGTKADIYEGGHRVPFLMRWPARFQGGQVSDALVELTDVFATVEDIVGETATGEAGMDSFSLLPLLDGEASSVRPFSVHHSINGTFALRRGDWKMIEGRGSGGFTAPRNHHAFDDKRPGQLYHLGSDPQETKNQWAEESRRVSEMRALLKRIKNDSAVAVAE